MCETVDRLSNLSSQQTALCAAAEAARQAAKFAYRWSFTPISVIISHLLSHRARLVLPSHRFAQTATCRKACMYAQKPT